MTEWWYIILSVIWMSFISITAGQALLMGEYKHGMIGFIYQLILKFVDTYGSVVHRTTNYKFWKPFEGIYGLFWQKNWPKVVISTVFAFYPGNLKFAGALSPWRRQKRAAGRKQPVRAVRAKPWLRQSARHGSRSRKPRRGTEARLVSKYQCRMVETVPYSCAYIISQKSTKNHQFENWPCCLGLIQQVPTKIEATWGTVDMK